MYAIYQVLGCEDFGYWTTCYRKNLDVQGVKKHIAIIKSWKHHTGKYYVVKTEEVENFKAKWANKREAIEESWKHQEKKTYKVDASAYKDLMENR